MSRTYSVIVRQGDPGEVAYWAEVPALPGCFTDGWTVAEVLANAREAVELYLSALIDDGRAVPAGIAAADNPVHAVTVEV